MIKSCLCCISKKSEVPDATTKCSIPTVTATDGVSSGEIMSPDKVTQITGMTLYERKLIRKAGQIIFDRMHLENKGVTFLIAFFKAYPHHQRYFKQFRGLPPDELKSLPHLENHGRRVMDQMSVLVQHLEQPSFIKEQLEDLVKKHGPRRVKPRQMKDMLEMFVQFTKQQLETEFTPQCEEAWRKLITFMLSVMDEASKKMTASGMPRYDNGSVTYIDHSVDAEDSSSNAAIAKDDGHGDGYVGADTNVNKGNRDRVNEGNDEADDDDDDCDDEEDIMIDGSGDNGSSDHVTMEEQNGGGKISS